MSAPFAPSRRSRRRLVARASTSPSIVVGRVVRDASVLSDVDTNRRCRLPARDVSTNASRDAERTRRRWTSTDVAARVLRARRDDDASAVDDWMMAVDGGASERVVAARLSRACSRRAAMETMTDDASSRALEARRARDGGETTEDG